MSGTKIGRGKRKAQSGQAAARRNNHVEDLSDDDGTDRLGRDSERSSEGAMRARAARAKGSDTDEDEEEDDQHEEVTGGGTQKKRRKTAKFKKHPDAPKRFRSAFIIFSQQRHKELRAKLNEEGGDADTMNIAGQISDEWRTLGQDAKKKWEEMAREDKERYQREKALYAGPWKVRTNLRKPKDPNSPKKPVPAYFAFSNERRQEVKNQNPNASNGDISRILSKMWKEASEEIRKMYLDREAREREKYTDKMVEWKEKRKREADEENELKADESKKAFSLGEIRAQPQNGSAAPQGLDHISLISGGNAAPGLLAQAQGSNQPSSMVMNPQASSYGLPSNSEDAYRMLQESSSFLPQGVLGTPFLQQVPQNAGGLNQDLLARLLSTVQAPQAPQQNASDGNLIQQVVLAALQQQQQQQQPPPPQVNLGNQGFGGGTFGGQWLNGGVGGNSLPGGNMNSFGQGSGDASRGVPPAWPTPIQQTGNMDSNASMDIMNFFNRQSQMVGPNGNNAGDVSRSLQQMGGPDSGNGAFLNSMGAPGGGADNNFLLRLLGQQQQQMPNGFDQPVVSAGITNSTASSSNASQDQLLQSILRQMASGGIMPQQN